ncbi:hypothetical protein ACP70R_030905 [Stipagrostis hirtigluma subsp. patula]
MDSAEPAARFCALEAELAAKSLRIAELEARVSCLEAENARLSMAMAKGEGADRTGEEDHVVGRLEEGLGGHKQEAAEMVAGGADCGGVIVLSDGEDGIAVDSNKGRSPEVRVVSVPTPRKRAARVVTGESEDEEPVEGVEGCSGSSKGDARGDINVDLEDDDVSVTAPGKKRAAALVVTSDSEDEDMGRGRRGNAKDVGGDDDNDEVGDGQEEGVTPSRKRTLCGFSDSENEDCKEGVRLVSSPHTSQVPATQIERWEEDDDDRIPICQVFKKMRKARVSDDDDELGEAKGCSTPATRRSARLVKNQSKGRQAARRVLNFVEPNEREGSEDDMEEDDDMDEFINDDNSSENASDSDEDSCAEPEVSGASTQTEKSSPEESDGEINYAAVMACIGRKRKAKDWKFEGDMLAAFHEHPELCLKAVCALYRKQTKEEQLEKATLVHNKQGFSQIDASRGSCIAEFLLDGDLYGPLKKTVHDLEAYDRYALDFCRKVAARYSKQLFAIYQNKEDPYFHP